MGWFSNVTDFLSSPGFRIGAGVAGLASGAGAFSDMGGWGTALQGLSGAANLAAGGASAFGPNRSTLDKVTGALQLGLGGYNVGQSLGAVGSFGDIWNSLGGGGGATTPAIGADSTFPAIPAAPGTPATPAAASAGGGRTTADDTFRGFVPNENYAQLPSVDPGGGVINPDATVTPTPRVLGPTEAYIPDRPPPPLAPGVDPNAGETPGLRPNGVPGRVGPGGTPPGPTTTLPTVPATTPQPFVGHGHAGAAIPPHMLQTGDWFDRAWNNLLTSAETNPVNAAMQALQVGGMLVGLFAQSRSDIAQEAMSQMDPSAPNGAEFRRLFEERARKEIEDQARTVRSGLEAKFAGRGMLRSTVYTNAIESLETARIKLLADLPLTSLNAWNATPQGSGRALQAGASYAQATSTPMDFASMTRVLGQSPFAQQLAANASRTPNTPNIPSPPVA